MKTKLLCLFLALNFVLPGTALSQGIASLEEAKNAIVRLEVERKSKLTFGTGFFISPSGHILTAAHVVLPVDGRPASLVSTEITVVTRDGRELSGRVLELNQALDLALLKVRTADLVPSLSLGDSSRITEKEELTVVGHPRFLPNRRPEPWKESRVTVNTIISSEQIVVDEPLFKGHSGGPVLNDDLEVVAVASFLEERSGTGFLIPINDAKGFLVTSGVAISRVENVEKRITLLGETIGDVSGYVSDLEGRLSDLQGAVAGATDFAKSLESTTSQLSARLAMLSFELEQFEAQTKEQISNATAAIEAEAERLKLDARRSIEDRVQRLSSDFIARASGMVELAEMQIEKASDSAVGKVSNAKAALAQATEKQRSGERYRVIQIANIRNSPGSSGQVLRTLSRDTEVRVVAQTGSYYRIKSPVEGYLFKAAVRKVPK